MSIRSIARAVGATIVTSSLVAASILIIAAPASAAVVDVYDTIPDPHQSDRASLAYSSNSITEFGSTVELAVGTDRTLHEIEIGFSNWSCETGFYQTPATPCVTTPGTSFVHPVTVNLYADAGVGTAGALIATVTKQVTVPFRPSASAECTDPSRPGQYQDAAGVCTSGLFFTSVFDFSGLALTVPDRFTIGVTYNTSNSGFAPIGSTPIPGTNAGYDALNVAIEGETPPGAGVFTETNFLGSHFFNSRILWGLSRGPVAQARAGGSLSRGWRGCRLP